MRLNDEFVNHVLEALDSDRIKMALTAKEWVWLPREEQERRAWELSPHECFLLRTLYDYVHPTEEEKANLTPEEWERVTGVPYAERKALKA